MKMVSRCCPVRLVVRVDNLDLRRSHTLLLLLLILRPTALGSGRAPRLLSRVQRCELVIR